MPSPKEVLDAIDKWRSLYLRTSPPEEIYAKFTEIFYEVITSYHGSSVPGDGYLKANEIGKLVQTKRNFYRIRKSKKMLSSIHDFWAPPKDKAPLNRCNFEGHPMLYISENATTPFEELSVKPDEQIYLIKYSLKLSSSLELSRPFVTDALDSYPHDSKEDLIAQRIAREFLRSEFTKPVGKGTEFLYNLTACICWYMYKPLPPDGYVYPSIVNANKTSNIALFPAAQKKLELEDVRIVELTDAAEWCSDPSVNVDDSVWRPILDGKTYFIKSRFQANITGDAVGWSPIDHVGAF